MGLEDPDLKETADNLPKVLLEIWSSKSTDHTMYPDVSVELNKETEKYMKLRLD